MMEEQRKEKKRIIQNEFNKVLKKKWLSEDFAKGKEIDLSNEWVRGIEEDSSIIYDYEKIGWKVMQYREQYSNGLVRNWVNFKNPNYKKRR